MTNEDQLPKWYSEGAIAFSNSLQAHFTLRTRKEVPAKLQPYLYPEGTWQYKAINSYVDTMFKDVPKIWPDETTTAYRVGFTLGLLTSSIKLLSKDIAETELLHLTQAGKLLNAVDPKANEAFFAAYDKWINEFTLEQEVDYAKGQVDGLQSIAKDGSAFKRESDRNTAYMIMLILGDQLKMLDSWKVFHLCISELAIGYAGENRFLACKKMAQDVGFTPVGES